MAYTKTNWQDLPNTTTPITATNLNNMETGIKENDNKLLGNAIAGNMIVEGIKTKNLFNKSVVINNYTFDSNGGVLFASGYFYQTNYIPVESNTTYTISSAISSVGSYRIVEYNSSYEFITRDYNTPGNVSMTITTNANTKYVRISALVSQLDTLQFEKGATATSYMPGVDLSTGIFERYGEGVRNSTFTFGACRYFKIGPFVIAILSDLYGNSSQYEGTLFTGLPKAQVQQIFLLRSYSTDDYARVVIDTSGNLKTHYSNIPATSSGKQFYGITIYLSSE